MKRVWKFGLASALLLALGALGGGSASATVLCSAEEETCRRVNTIPPTTIAAEAENVKLESLFGTVVCAESKIVANSTKEEGEPLPGELTELTFGGCEVPEKSACTVTSINLPYKLSAGWVSNGDGTLTAKESGKGSPATKVECPELGLSCTYSATEIVLDVEGGNPALVLAKKEPLKGSGFCFSASGTFSGEYEVTFPAPLFLAHTTKTTALCAVEPELQGGVLDCPTGKGFAGAISAALALNATFTSTKGKTGTVTCEEGPLAVEMNEDGTAKGTGLTIAFKTGGGACPSTLSEKPNVSVELTNQPYNVAAIEYVQTTAPQGLIWFNRVGTSGFQLVLTINGEKCTYNPTATEGTVTNGGGGIATKIFLAATWALVKGATTVCPETEVMEALLKSSTTFYVAKE